MTLVYKTTKYLQTFNCTGGDCEDTCCRGWDIWFDQRHYETLRDTLAQENGDEARKFRQYVKLSDKTDRTTRHYALLTLKPDGYCPFLLTDGWCQIHQKYDIKPLSDICAYYPRILSKYGNTVEMSGALSCPEMVRQCLFADDAMTVCEFEPALLPRPDDYPLTWELEQPTGEFYYDHFKPVREVLLKLASLEGFALHSRLYFLASFASRLSSFYHHESKEQKSEQLEQELKRALRLSTLEKQDDFVSKYIPADPVAVIVIQAVLQLRIQNYPHDVHSLMVEAVLQGYENRMELNGKAIPLPAEALWQMFQSHQSLVDNRFATEIENCLTRYLHNCLYREWFITMPDLFTYIHMLTIRIAILRFLLYSHPDIIELAASSATSGQDDIARLRQVIVNIIYRHSRAIDHNMSFLKVVFDAMHEQQMMTFEYALPFIKF